MILAVNATLTGSTGKQITMNLESIMVIEDHHERLSRLHSFRSRANKEINLNYSGLYQNKVRFYSTRCCEVRKNNAFCLMQVVLLTCALSTPGVLFEVHSGVFVSSIKELFHVRVLTRRNKHDFSAFDAHTYKRRTLKTPARNLSKERRDCEQRDSP